MSSKFKHSIRNLQYAAVLLFFYFSLNQRTPLHIAARRADVETVQCLVDRGAHINAQEKSGVSICVEFEEKSHFTHNVNFNYNGPFIR